MTIQEQWDEITLKLAQDRKALLLALKVMTAHALGVDESIQMIASDAIRQAERP